MIGLAVTLVVMHHHNCSYKVRGEYLAQLRIFTVLVLMHERGLGNARLWQPF